MAQRAQQALAGLMCATQLLLCPLTADLALPAPAQAVLKSPNAQIPRSVDAALRRCVPLQAGRSLVLSFDVFQDVACWRAFSSCGAPGKK